MELHFATGNVWKILGNDLEKAISLIRNLNMPVLKGVELTIGKQKTEEIRLSRNNLKWLKGLKRVSIHAPFTYKHLKNDPEKIKNTVLEILDLYSTVNSKTLVMHANEPGFIDYVYKTTDMNISIEQMEKYKQMPLEEFDKLIRKYPKAGVCLDVAHSYSYSTFETQKIIEKYGPRIKEVHLSGMRNLKAHIPLSNAPKRFFKSIRPLKNLQCPIVIEETMGDVNMDWIRNEVIFIKNKLENL